VDFLLCLLASYADNQDIILISIDIVGPLNRTAVCAS